MRFLALAFALFFSAALQAGVLIDETSGAVGGQLIWRSQLRCYYNVDQVLLGKREALGSEVPADRLDFYLEQAVTAELVRQHYEKTGEELPDTALQEHEAEWRRFYGSLRTHGANDEQILESKMALLALTGDSCKEFLKQRLIAAKFLEKLAMHGEEQRDQWVSEAKKRLLVRGLTRSSGSH